MSKYAGPMELVNQEIRDAVFAAARTAQRATDQGNVRLGHGRMRKRHFSVAEPGCPLAAAGTREAQVRAERVAHRVDEPVGAARREAILPPQVEHFHAGSVPVDPRYDPADEAVANAIGST